MNSDLTEPPARSEISTLHGLLRWRAREHGHRRAFVFLQDGETEEAHLTYEMLDERARSIAAHLQSRGLAGERVLLILPSGLEFVASFLGCLYAGAVAVPAYAPRGRSRLRRLRGIVDDARPKLVLTTESILKRMEPALEETGLDAIPWLAAERIQTSAGAWRDAGAGGDALALLQYTSGSVSQPKGVKVSHGNLLSNHRMIREAFAQSERTTIVSWLPLFHDMGLIGNVLQAVYLGAECVLMPPEMFLTKPVRWLQAISRYGARNSGGPNFAYDLCTQRVTAEQRASIDLSSWELAFVGAEPVRGRTLERFAETFAPCGFRREALYPCFGLAEATLFVSGNSAGTGFAGKRFAAREMEQGSVVPAASGESRELVHCGKSWDGLQVVIVNPDTAVRCAEGKVGEIWVTGPSVAQGYWNRHAETEHTFRAQLAEGGAEFYLRTGDLGFFHEGMLFISGRLKDLIIVAGRNHHPEDIEQTAEESHPAIRKGCCAAFAVEDHAVDRVVIAAELERTHRTTKGDAVVRAVMQAVAEEHDLGVHAVVLLKPAEIPKTSSGKIQRRACRAAFLAESLNLWKEPE